MLNTILLLSDLVDESKIKTSSKDKTPEKEVPKVDTSIPVFTPPELIKVSITVDGLKKVMYDQLSAANERINKSINTPQDGDPFNSNLTKDIVKYIESGEIGDFISSGAGISADDWALTMESWLYAAPSEGLDWRMSGSASFTNHYYNIIKNGYYKDANWVKSASNFAIVTKNNSDRKFGSTPIDTTLLFTQGGKSHVAYFTIFAGVLKLVDID